jgi:Tol biopolymer transport system component
MEYTRLKNLLLSISCFSLIFSFSFFSKLELTAQFGKNKVQYQNFTWNYIQSKNFDIYFAEGGEYLAKFTAISSEKALVSIQSTLQYTLRNRISIIVFNSHNEFQQNNVITSYLPEGVGGVTELFKNRIIVPFEGRYEQFNHVIHHELVHGVLNEMFYGGSIQNVISNNIRVELPLWMNEGFAEFESIGGLDVATDMFIRDLLLNEKMPDLPRLQGYLSYRGGQSFYWYVAQKYGKPKIAELIARVKNSPSVDVAFSATFKKNVAEFSDQWKKDLKKFYYPDVDKYERVEDFAVRLTDHKKDQNFYNSSPAISPNGEKIAYISDRDDVFGVYILDLKRNNQIKKIISSDRALDFEDLNILTPGITWSPNSFSIAISAKSGGQDAIYIVDAEKGSYKKHEIGFKHISSLTWSPDGKTIVFVGSVNEQPDLFSFNTSNSKVDKITNDIFSDEHPTFSPDGSLIYFISDRNGMVSGSQNKNNYVMWEHDFKSSDIYSINIATKEIKQITYDKSSKKTSIVVSPTAKSLLFVSDENGIGNIFELDLESSKKTALTNSLTGLTQLSMSKDGSKLVFTSQNEVGYDIYALKYPFDQKRIQKELPLTELRKSEVSSTVVSTEKVTTQIETNNEKETFVGYEDVEIEFSRQIVVDETTNDKVVAKPETTEFALSAKDTNFAVQPYKVNFTTDYIQSNLGFNNFLGWQQINQMSFSDLMGNHQINVGLNLLLDLVNSSFFVEYNYLPKTIDYSFYISQFPGIVQLGDFFIYRIRDITAGTTASLPLTRYQRFEFSTDIRYLLSQNLEIPSRTTPNNLLTVPKIQYVFDNSRYGFSPYAPVEGTRMIVSAVSSIDMLNSSFDFLSLSTDIRHYFALGKLASLSVRGAGGISIGSAAQQFFVGGTPNWINLEFANTALFRTAKDFAFFNLSSLPMRGFPLLQNAGTKYFQTNTELRFPILAFFTASELPALVQAINGAVFMDMGGAWTDNFQASQLIRPGFSVPKNLLMSAGFGVRSIFLGFPLKVDIGWRNDYNSISDAFYMFSIGGDF